MAEVLITGAAGGREEMLRQAMEASPEVDRVEVHADLMKGLDAFRGSSEKPFVIIGSEAMLVKGVADDLRRDGHTVLGASGDAAGFEASKARTVRLARKYGVTHPDTYIVDGLGYEGKARRYVAAYPPESYVTKADGLRGGKGAFIHDDRRRANDILEQELGLLKALPPEERIINFANRRKGKELSAIAIVGAGSKDYFELPLAQDFKRAGEKDKGPNTGGVGSYSPLPESVVSLRQREQVSEMFDKILPGMENEGANIQGAVVYLGIMLDEELNGDPTLIEINMRPGDPETQPILTLLMRNRIDCYRLLRSAAERQIERPNVDMRALKGAALTVCLAANGYGYRDDVQKGSRIYGLDQNYGPDVTIQLAGVIEQDGEKRVNGGRVLYVTGYGESVDAAADKAYGAIDVEGTGVGIGFEDRSMTVRTDIGHLARKGYL